MEAISLLAMVIMCPNWKVTFWVWVNSWKGYEILIKDRCLYLWDQINNLIAKVFMSRNKMFILNLKTIEAKCLKISVQDEAWCWDLRLDHLNFGEVNAIGEKKVVKWMPSINCVKRVFLESKLEEVFQKKPHQKQLTHFNMYISMYMWANQSILI